MNSMIRVARSGEIRSVADVVARMKPGGLFVISVSAPGAGALLASALVTRAPSPRRARLITLRPMPPGDLPPVRAETLGGLPSAAAARSALARSAKAYPDHALAVLDLSAPPESWYAKPSAKWNLLESVLPVLIRKKARVVAIVCLREWPDDRWTQLTKRSQFCLNIMTIGGTEFAHFVAADAPHGPAFFLPRRITLSDGSLDSRSPFLPAPATASSEGERAEQGKPGHADLLGGEYRRVFEHARDGIVLFNEATGYREPNDRAGQILGYPKDELGGVAIAQLAAGGHVGALLRALVILRNKGLYSGDLALRRKNGRIVIVNVSASALGPGLYMAILRDVTGARKSEQTSERTGVLYRQIIEDAAHPQGLFINRKLSEWNKAFALRFPSAVEKQSDRVTLHRFFGKSAAGFLRDAVALLEGESPRNGSISADVELPAPDGQSRGYEVSAIATMSEAVRGLHLTFVDITARREALRRLEESERTLRTLIENSVAAIAVVRDGAFVTVNRGFLEMFAFGSAEVLSGKSFGECVQPRGRKAVLDQVAQAAAGGPAVSAFEFQGLRKDGGRIHVQARAGTVLSGGLPALLCHLRDITEEKKLLANLTRRMKEQEIVEHVLHAIQHTITLEPVLASGTTAAMKWLGFECGAVYRGSPGTRDLALAFQQGLPEPLLQGIGRQSMDEGVTGFVVKTLEPLLLSTAEYPAYLPYGSLFSAAGFHSVVYVPLLAGEELAAVLLLCSSKTLESLELDPAVLASLGLHFGDAVRNAAAFERVSAAERQHREALENISDTVYQTLPGGALLYISPQVERLVGHTPDELIRSTDLWRSLIHPDDRSKYSERISNQGLGKEEFDLEYRLLPKGKAAYRWVRDSVRYRRDPDGALLAVHGVIADITGRVEAAAAVEQAGERRADILESVQEGVIVYDPDFSCLEWNKAMEELTGIDRTLMVGRSAIEGAASFNFTHLPTLLRQALEGKDVNSQDTSYRMRGSTEEKFFWGRFSPLRDRGGAITGVVATVTDITARKGLEQEVRESEETLRKVVDAMGDAMMISDLQGRVWEVNREFVNLTGYSRSEVLGTTFPYPWLVEEEMARLVLWISALREKKYLRDFDMTWRAKDGRTVAISMNTTLLRSSAGEPVAMLNLARDISERRRLSNELAEKNLQMEMLNRIISKANSTIEFSEIFSTIAEEILALLTYDQITVMLLSDDAHSMTIHACISPTVPSLPVGEVLPLEGTVSGLAIGRATPVIIGGLPGDAGLRSEAALPASVKSQVSIPLYLNNRVIGTFNAVCIRENAFTGRELTYLQPIADQIGAMIDRSRLFERVSDDSKYIHNLLNSIDSAMFTLDRGYCIREVNTAWRSLVGKTEMESESTASIGRHLRDVPVLRQLWEDLRDLLPAMFDRTVAGITRDIELRPELQGLTFHLVVNPMVINGRVTGLVFTLTDVTSLKKNEEEIRRRNRELVALNDMSASISRSLNLDEVLSVGLAGTKEITSADGVVCYLAGSEKGKLVFGHQLGLPDQFSGEMRVIDLASGEAGGVLAAGKTLFIDEHASSDERISGPSRALLGRLGFQAIAALPLVSKDRILALMIVGYRTTRRFGEQERRFLELIANQISPAIENAQLYAEVRAQVERITSMYEFGKTLTGALDTRTVLDAAYNEISKSVRVDRFALDVFDESRRVLTRVYENIGGEKRSTGSGPGDREFAVSAGEFTESVLAQGTPHRGESAEGGSVMALPVRSKQRISGILSVSSRLPDAYTEVHLRLLQSIANLTEIAIDRALLYEDIVAKSAEIENRNKDLDDFTYVVSHDLKEPLITIEGYSKIVLAEYGQKVGGEANGFLSSVVQASERMKDLIDDLLTLSRIGRVSELQQPVQVGKVIADVQRDFEFTLRKRHATVAVPPDLPEVRYNRTQLSMVFRNLISNGIKFNTTPEPRVDISFTESPAEYTFAVADNGIGIDSRHFDKIFVIFQRLHPIEEYQGTGAGLTIVKKIVENHRGRIWVDSVVGKGTTFHFTVPK